MAQLGESKERRAHPEPLRIEDCSSLKLPGGWTLQGYSLGGVRTGFRLKELKLLLDAGVACDAASRCVLVTHCHQDHTLGLPMCCDGRDRRTTVASNGRCLELLAPYMESMAALSDDPEDSAPGCSYAALEPGAPLWAVPGRSDVAIATFRCHHRTACNAYGIYAKKQSLLPALRGSSKEEIKKLRRSGAPVTEVVYTPRFLFCGDTTSDFFRDEDNLSGFGGAYPCGIGGFPVVAIECTLLDRDAAPLGHMHYDALAPYLRRYEDGTTFIVMHHSARHTMDSVAERFAPHRNVVLWHRGDHRVPGSAVSAEGR